MLHSRVNYHSLPYISEATRKELVTKSLKQSPERVARSKEYKITGKINVNVDQLIDGDKLTVTIPVNEYTCTIEFNNVIKNIAFVVDRQYKGNVNFDAVEKALNRAIDKEEDLKVNCTCKDFYYRFSYVATKNGYKNGKEQTIPAPIRNPRDDKGSFCKHLIMILKNKDWVRKLASVVNYLIKEYYDKIVVDYNLDPDHFYINKSGQHSRKDTILPFRYKNRSSKDKVKADEPMTRDDKFFNKYYLNKDEDAEDDEELQLKV